MGWDLPGGRTLCRFLGRIPPGERDYHRKGKKYWREYYIPSVLRDYNPVVLGEVYIADHVQLNVAVRHSSGEVIFFWLTIWMDMRTRKILSWRLQPINLKPHLD